jgi:hypothetical protein
LILLAASATTAGAALLILARLRATRGHAPTRRTSTKLTIREVPTRLVRVLRRSETIDALMGAVIGEGVLCASVPLLRYSKPRPRIIAHTAGTIVSRLTAIRPTGFPPNRLVLRN